jgi:membrane protein implicated in regulation of membrane protease activity
MFDKPELFWFFIGLGLFLAELVLPGFFIFFFGLGAWITALVCLIGDPSINTQIIIFALTSVLTLAGLRRIIRKKLFYSNGDKDRSIEDEFTGKEALAANDFGHEKKGKVYFKGTTWTSESKYDISEGQRVTIIEKDNFTLIVEPKNN